MPQSKPKSAAPQPGGEEEKNKKTPLGIQIDKLNEEDKLGLDEIFEANSDEASKMKETLSALEEKERREAMGLDIDFDVTKLITEGIIEKKGLPIIVGPKMSLYADMHTLNKAEKLIAEMIVEKALKDAKEAAEKQPEENRAAISDIRITKAYYELMGISVLAMSVTRLNNAMYPTPPLELESRATEKFHNEFVKKVELFKMFLYKFPDEIVDGMTFLYQKLDRADILLEEQQEKKSSRP